MAASRAAEVALVGIPYDLKSSYLRGAAEAPPAIRQALWCDASNSFTELGVDIAAGGIVDSGDLDLGDGSDRSMITAGISAIVEAGALPLSLGGDHSITHPILRAVRRAHPRLTVLHVDAHPDLYESFGGDRDSHACPFARVMEEGLADRLIQVGIRTCTAHQREQARRYGVESVEMRDWRDDWALELDGPLYLSLDLDSLDPAFAPGVSHREPGGFTVRQVIRLIHGLQAPLIGADVVELNPSTDLAGVTASVAAKLVKETAGVMLAGARVRN